ncbi:MAG: MMPL family transporter [Arenimonas sp.]|nr:MMPL family transporter [Arenimonas sp.]MBP6309539.1 MMPL family transporter [Arenimonas sp.]
MSKFDDIAEKIIFKNRAIILALFVLITGAMVFFASQLKVDAGFNKQVPLQHEYMRTFTDYMSDFGGANRVLIAVIAKDGNMFSKEYMATLENITSDVINLDATDDAKTRSLFTPNVRFIEVVEDGLSGGNVIPQDFTPNLEGFEATPEQFAKIKGNIVKAGIVGRLVAKDYSGSMVWGDLIPESNINKVDYNVVAKQLEGIRKKYENENTSIHIIGFAKMVGDISDGAMSVLKFFLLTIAFTWLLLFLYSSSAKLASLTVLAALVSVIWMLGALRLMGFGIDPMNMLTPFLIFAIAVSHGEQMINRFRGEIFFGGLEEGTVEELRERAKFAVDPLTAATRSFHALLIPGTVALLAGCIGFGAIMVIPIQMIRELAITATVGVALTILTDLILLPILLSYTKLRNLEKKREFRLRQLTQFDKIWVALSKLSQPKAAATVLLIGAVMWVSAWMFGNNVMIGDAQQGVAELRPEARYNQDARLISSKFALGVDTMNVIVEAGPSACTTSYKAMETIDRFAWHMSNVEGVEQVITLPMAAKMVNAGWNDGSVRWRVLPRDPDTLRQATQSFETDSGLLNADCSAIPVTIFTKDHKSTTIDRIVAETKKFRTDNKAFEEGFAQKRNALMAKAQEEGKEYSTDQVNFRLATGPLGVQAATNDTVRDKEHLILWLLYGAVFLMCWISFKCPRSALCVTLPLMLVTELGHSLMVLLGIGMKVNTLTVVALGVGIGVDYGIYIFARMREAMLQGKTLSESYFIALKTTGIAIFYTALTLAVGVAMWIFSDLKFQADMGVMLTFMFVVNMIAAIIFLPALCRWILRPNEKDNWVPHV